MQHQRQRNAVKGVHDQRIGCDQKVRRLEGKKMRRCRRGHCPHDGCHGDVGNAEKAPRVCCPVSANGVSCQQRSHGDGSGGRRHVPNPRGQRELPGQASVSPKYEENPARDAVDLSRYEPMQRDRGDQPCNPFRSREGNRGDSERDQQTEQYRRHPVPVCRCEIPICRAEILSDGHPAHEHRR